MNTEKHSYYEVFKKHRAQNILGKCAFTSDCHIMHALEDGSPKLSIFYAMINYTNHCRLT